MDSITLSMVLEQPFYCAEVRTRIREEHLRECDDKKQIESVLEIGDGATC